MTPVTACAGRHLALFGLGGSGLVTAQALLAGGARVTAWDDSTAARKAAQLAGIEVADLREADWSAFASLVLAPGVPLTHPVPHWTVGLARAAGVAVIGDIELFCRERDLIAPGADFIAITGTNGKSTTTALTAHLFRTAGRDVQMGGNIGVPALALEPPAAGRIHILELSSFQIDLAPSLNPSLGILLNLTPDHIDRHGTMANYAVVKERLIARSDRSLVSVDDDHSRAIQDRAEASLATQGPVPLRPACGEKVPDRADEGSALFGKVPLSPLRGPSPRRGEGDQPASVHLASEPSRATGGNPGPHFAVSVRGKVGRGVHLDSTRITLSTGPGQDRLLGDLAGLDRLRGIHNAQNACFAAGAAACWALGADDAPSAEATIQRGLRTFGGLPHRMEEVGRRGRVLFVNDSKATNADAAAQSLRTFRDIHWIAGGVAKEGGIGPLGPLFGHIAKAYLIGAAAAAFATTLQGHVPTEVCGTLDAAVAAAARAAGQADAPEPVVLLAPACASTDQFANFEARGEAFRALVHALGDTP